jgi:uncharacterized membrane protein (Fun14 family)
LTSYIPDLSVTFLVAAALPLIIGFIVGMIIRSALKIGIAIAVVILVLLLLGVVTPSQVLTPLATVLKSGSVSAEVDRLAHYLPWSSLAFLIGLLIGILKG